VSPKFSPFLLEKIKEQYRDIRIIPGAGTREEIGAALYSLLDQTKSDWMVNLDDDDIWLNSYSLDARDDSGIIYGGSIYFRPWLKPHLQIRVAEAKPVNFTNEIGNARGSFQSWRIAAWRDVRELAWTMTETEYDGWRVYFLMMKKKWKLQTTKEFAGLVNCLQRLDNVAPKNPLERHLNGWPGYCELLENLWQEGAIQAGRNPLD
jgi:hypothetical protein